jgi:hypothetical protein
VLESDYVSVCHFHFLSNLLLIYICKLHWNPQAHLHLWIDLTFGCSLAGVRAVENKNVPLKHTTKVNVGGPPIMEKNPGFFILFDRPHPKRQRVSKAMTGLENEQEPRRSGDCLRDVTGYSPCELSALAMEATLSLDKTSGNNKQQAPLPDQNVLAHFENFSRSR